MKNNKTNQTNKSTYKTINGIQTLPSGSYRVRKSINGIKYDGTFSKKKDAQRYLTLLKNEASKLKTTSK